MDLEKVYPKIIANSCQKILAELLRRPVTILPESEKPQESRYLLNLEGFDHYGASDNNRRVRVVPFVKDYWLYFSIEYNVEIRDGRNYNFYLKDVYMAIFYGSEATDQDKLLMFRSEWANKDDDETRIPHPQPHWHIHTTSSYVNAAYVSDFNTYLDIKEEDTHDFFDELSLEVENTKPKVSNLSGFHFAMCAGWIFDLSDKHVLTASKLFVWLRQSIIHIQQQLEYSANKF